MRREHFSSSPFQIKMKDSKVRVPRDVEEYINKKRAIRITAFAVVEIMLAALLIFVIFDYVVASNYPELSFVLYLLVIKQK